MTLRRQAVQGAAWSLVSRISTHVLSLLVFLVLARLLAPEAFGLVAMAGVLIAFMQVFLDQGFGAAIVQRSDLEPGHLDTAFWTAVALALLLVGVAWVVAGPAARAFGEPGLVAIVRVLALGFLVGAMRTTQESLFRRRLAFKLLAVRGLVAAVVGGAVGVGMAFAGWGAWSLVGQLLTTNAAGTILLWTLSDWSPGLAVSGRHFRELFSFGVNVLGLNLLNFANRQADHLLIGLFLGSLALGYYAVAYRVLLLITNLLLTTVGPVAFSVFSRVQHDLPRLRQGYYAATRMIGLVAFPTFMGLAVLAPEAIVVGFGAQWAPSVPVLRWLALIGIVHAAFAMNTPALQGGGRPGWVLLIAFLNAIVNILLFVIVVRWGIVAVAAAYTIRGWVMAPLQLVVLRRVIGLDLKRYFHEVGPPLLAAAGMAVVLLLVGQWLHQAPLTARLAILVPVGVVTYTASILALRPRALADLWSTVQSIAPAVPK